MKRFLCTVLTGCLCAQVSAQNLIDNYLTGTPTYSVVATATNQISQPRDLDFKPHTNELWIVNKGSTAGGSNVIIYNAGMSNQSSEYRKDSHSGHFMIYPSAIAFGQNGEFANTNEIMNTAGPGSTFMGPALWTADTNIFARVFQNNWVAPQPLGSHLDMLHQSPFSMGIAHDTASIYWVFDGHNGNLCRYDFGMHHSPGYDDHSNGVVWRYTDVPLTRVPNLPGHMIKDKATGWLYIIDAGTKKLKRVNPATASNVGSLTVPASGAEALAGYWQMTGATVQVLDSFMSSQPCGIDLYNGRLLVGDFNNGNIHVYNITGTIPVKLGTIATGQSGMMGLKVGPDGKIWFVNQTQNTVVRIDPTSAVNNDVAVDAITAPNLVPFDAHFYNTGFNQCAGTITPIITIRNTGANTLSSATIQYRIDNGNVNTFSWSGSLAPNATASVTLPASAVSNGAHKLMVEALNPNGVADANPANNTKMGSFRALNPVASYPLSENFSSSAFPPANWNYLSHNFHNSFTHQASVGAVASGSIKMDNFSGAEDITGQRDYLLTPRIDFTSANMAATLSFNVAYAQYDATSMDRLTVNVSTDCGQTWNQVYTKSGTALSTTTPKTTAFTPTANQWRTESVSLAAYAGQPDVILQFLTTSGYGNNLYLDDIMIANTTGVADKQAPSFVVYPNPATNNLTVETGAPTGQAIVISLHDVLGKAVKTQRFNGATEKLTFDITDVAGGTYILRVVSGDRVQQEKISVVK
jgi:hypothetical protein